jgi:hypothetical protein
MTPLHLGPLHPVEQALTLVLAFGPFVVLAIVVWLRRRADAAADPTAAEAGTEGGTEGQAAERPQRDR